MKLLVIMLAVTMTGCGSIQTIRNTNDLMVSFQHTVLGKDDVKALPIRTYTEPVNQVRHRINEFEQVLRRIERVR